VAIPLAWGVLAAMWFIVLIGDALHLPNWLLDVLPFSATPYLPYADLTWSPLVIMTLVAGALIWIGLNRFKHRDVQPG
jgi:ABC-2 type transport system permease protein